MCKTCGCKDAETLEGEDCGCKHENEAESFGADGKYTNNQISKMNYREITTFDELLEELIYEEMYDNFDGDNFSPYKAWKGLDIKDRKKIISKISKDKRYKEYNKVKRIDDSSDNKRGKVLKVGELKEALKFANDNDEVCVGSLYDENAIVPSNRVYKKGKEVIISGDSGYHISQNTQQALEDANNYSRKYSAESFQAHDHSHIYPSEELTPSHSHSSETFKSSNNNNNIMAAESKFDKLSDKIAKQYRKKGMSAKEAKEIGNKTAYTIGRKKYGKAGMAKKARAGMRAESFEAEKINTFSEIENEWKDSSVTIYDEDADEFYGVKEILVQKGDDVLEDGHPYLVLNKDSGDLDSQVFYRDFQTGYDAESFEADDDYVIVDRGNYRVRVHKKNLDRFNRSTMHKIHSERNKEGLMYDEETSRWIPLEAESFEAEEFFRCKNCDYNVELEVEAVFEDGLCSNCLVKEGFQKEYGTHGKWMKNGEYAKKIKGATYEDYDAESFEAQGNPDKRTTTQYANFYVGWEDEEGELRGGGKFKKFNDAKAQAEIVAKRNGNSRVVEKRGFALWTDDGKGMWQEGYDKTDAKKFYSAEGYSIGSGFRLGFGLGLGMLALSTVTTIVALAASTIDERQVE